MEFHNGMSAIKIAQNVNWHSQAGWNFSGMSAIGTIESKLRTSTGTHKLDGMSQ
jgi:hypothetical protein